MSMRADGGYTCDRCGRDVGNGSVQNSAIISDVRPTEDGPVPVRFDLCRDYPDPADPEKTVQGCRDRVLTLKALRHWMESRP